jgi:UDP-N-acetyl-D-galactosamine dehydrogenase
VLVLGITFKENVSDIRNTKVVELVRELMDYSINVHLHDPCASPNEVAHEYKLTLTEQISAGYDAVVVAVAHQEYRQLGATYFQQISHPDAVIMDLKGLFNRADFAEPLTYWRL